MTESQQATTSAPTCYRHPDRETWVSCGRCGKPLCPDCMRHGPVGVRCEDCLYPQGKGAPLAAPQNPGRALGIAAGVGVIWTLVLIAVGALTRSAAPNPNLLLSAIAGATVGWLLWRLVGRTWSRQTARAAWWLGLAIPLLAGVALWMINLQSLPITSLTGLVIMGRILLAALLSGLAARLAATKRR
ncbi:MAG: hypothetical protein ACYC7E_11875 [Armatimonadota bacterium]